MARYTLAKLDVTTIQPNGLPQLHVYRHCEWRVSSDG